MPTQGKDAAPGSQRHNLRHSPKKVGYVLLYGIRLPTEAIIIWALSPFLVAIATTRAAPLSVYNFNNPFRRLSTTIPGRPLQARARGSYQGKKISLLSTPRGRIMVQGDVTVYGEMCKCSRNPLKRQFIQTCSSTDLLHVWWGDG